jgi:hypothetical protein
MEKVMNYTARLENWLIDNKSGCLIGNIYDALLSGELPPVKAKDGA